MGYGGGALETAVVRVTTTGADGSAAGTADTDDLIQGEVLGVYLNYHASAPATTDVTLKTAGGAAPSYNLLAVSNANTDAFFAPAVSPVTSANGAITDAHRPFPVADKLRITVAEADALTNCVVAHILYRR